MKKAIDITWIVGVVISIVAIILMIIMAIFSAQIKELLLTNIINQIPDDTFLYRFITTYINQFTYTLFITLICEYFIALGFGIAGHIIAKKGEATFPHVFVLIAGILSDNPLFLVSGILGIVYSHKNLRKENTNDN